MDPLPDGVIRTFEVVKIHHEKFWLRQKRILIVTADAVMKAHPATPAQSTDPHSRWNPTKSHSLESLISITSIDRNQFSLQFTGDHAYFYNSDRAIEIVALLTRRRSLLRSARLLQPQRPEEVLLQFQRGILVLPMESEVSALALPVLDLVQCLRGGALDGSNEISSFQIARADEPLNRFRSDLNHLRGRIVHQLLTRERSFMSKLMGKAERRKLPKLGDEDESCLCAEEALQTLVFTTESFHSLWDQIVRETETEQRTFDRNAGILSKRPLQFFGVHRDFHIVKFDVVRDHFGRLGQCVSPSAMLDVVLVAVKSVFLSVESWYLQSQAEHEATYGADDIVPALIYIMVCCGLKNMCNFRRFVERLGHDSEATERAYYFTVFASAVQFIIDYDELTAEEASGLLVVSQELHSPFSTPRFERECSPSASSVVP